ncbi:S1C family serine protease [Hymenobacter sp. CRA2]|uniref:S1C family serine protease n=1 Tax=Hymenobacter sp. CRA2 TaxID=1955620 RepID=UPI00098E9018|nr:trypsin-like peptidase domain-containing protein [Hymenobacter sp. CRA2]OON68500.1 hypothetical protein B0919_12705 [Hymenobacter sp. CRA2]
MTKRSTLVISGLLISSTLLPSCATILSTPWQTVKVVGQPAGSTILVNDKEVKTRPIAGNPGEVKIRLRRNKNSEVRVKHEGYKDHVEMLYPDKWNSTVYLSLGALAAPLYTQANDIDLHGTGLVLGFAPYLIDLATGSHKRLNKKTIGAQLVRKPTQVAGSQTVQCTVLNVHLKGGDKMGTASVHKGETETLYFGKSLDVDSDHLKQTVNSSLKDLGYAVPATEAKSLFSTGANTRYTLQGEMRTVHLDVRASSPYEALARYETRCSVEVTWKLLNRNRQTVFEQKTTGDALKFEKGGSAAFEDAFENALYAFVGSKQVTTALAKPAGDAPEEKQAPIVLHRTALKPAANGNEIGAAARRVVTVETAGGHGSGCIISADGYIVTNFHVVGEQEEVKVNLPDGLEAKAKVVRTNPEMDLALLKVDVDGLTPFLLPTAGAADLGTDVFAIGTPADKELGQTITKGIISGRRKVEGHTILQTDVSINPGNSGGALVARSGELVGIVNAKLVGRGIEGIGFAIPAEQVGEALQLQYAD